MKTFIIGQASLFDNVLKLHTFEADTWQDALKLAGFGWVWEGTEVGELVTVEQVKYEAFGGDTLLDIKEIKFQDLDEVQDILPVITLSDIT